jgi:hypothetical protein
MDDMLAIAAFAMGFAAAGGLICFHLALRFKDKWWWVLCAAFTLVGAYIVFGHAILDMFKL